MAYPTLQEVESATHRQICCWCRFLPSPGWGAVGQPDSEEVRLAEASVMDRIRERLRDLGGFTPQISKSIGW